MVKKLRCLRAALASALCLGAGAPAAPVAGEVALSYRAPDGCPGEADFRERAADLFDFRDPFVRAGAPAASTMRFEIERDGKGYRGTLSRLDADGSTLASSVERHRTCDALVYVLAHRLKMIVEPATRAPAAAPSSAPAGQAPDPLREKTLWARLDRLEEAVEAQEKKLEEQAKRIAKLEAELKRARKMDLTYSLSMGVLMTANLTTTVGPGVWAGGDLRAGPLVMGLELRAVLPSHVVVGPYDLDLSQIVTLLTPCGRYSVFFGCAVAGAGVQIDHDSNFGELMPGDTATGFVPVVQLGGRVGVEVPLGETRFAIRGWGEVLFSTPPVEFGYDDTYFLDRPDVSAFFGLGFVVKLGKEGGE